MKILNKLMSGALLATTAVLSAQNCCPSQMDCDPCCDWFSDCEFSVYGEYLYWDLCRSTTDVATVTNPLGITQNLNFQGSYQSGYRVGGTFATGCWDFEIRYASIDSKKSITSEVSGGFYQAEQKIDYSVLDIQLGREISLNCFSGSLTPFIGVKCAWIDQTWDATLTNTIKYRGKIDYNAYGVALGTNFNWQICSKCVPISFVNRTSIALLKGAFSPKDYVRTLNDVVTNISVYDHSYSLCLVPEIYVGLDFDLFCCDCFTASAQVGYEAQYWSSLLFHQNSIPATINSNLLQGSLGINGLVARFQVGF